jgi:N-acetylmuramoyl-L-alanine amidase
VLLLCSCVLPAYAHRSAAWASAEFSKAQQLHNALESHPAQQLTRTDYERVINVYKQVYLGSPTSSKADPSVIASAELMEEEGRRFADDAILRAAVKQYEFLRQQYPGSKARFNALFRIGEIYKDDLHDRKHADEAFQEFVQLYPHHRLAEQARHEMAEPVVAASLKAETRKPQQKKLPTDRDVEESAEPRAAADEENEPDQPAGTSHGLVRITAVHQWSTPNSTRVAIDLGSDVKFFSQRIENPDRIFFDLLQTRLDRSLWRKTFPVNNSLLKEIRISQFKPGRTRVVLEVEKASDFKASLEANPPRLVIEVWNHPVPRNEVAQKTAAILGAGMKPKVNREQAAVDTDNSAPQEPVEAAAKSTKATASTTSDGVKRRVVEADDKLDDGDDAATKPMLARLNPPEIGTVKEAPPEPLPAKTIKNRSAKKQKPVIPEPDAHEAQPTAAGDRSLIRALDLKIGKIVIDPGHGGHDTGTIGPNGLEEKDLVLDVSKRLGRLLETRLGAGVVYTRTDDTFIPLEERTAIANREGADLFISIHANSSSDPEARGVETYYLNFTSSRDALEVAARENAVSEKSIHELQDLVKTIALKEKIEESHEFASDVEYSLHKGLAAKTPGIRDRGVKKAPFIVLIGANMPSILAEISFVSNPGDERRLETPEFRQRIAESLYRGIAKYVNGLSGVKVASKVEKDQGQ